MENLLESHDNWKTDIESNVSWLLEKFKIREEQLKNASRELELSKRTFEEQLKTERARIEKEAQQKTKAVEEAMLKLEAEKKHMNGIYEMQCSHVKLDVGGHIFSTSLNTLTRDKTSMLAVMFSGRHKLVRGKDNTYFIDRDGTHFRYILNYLRDDLHLDTLPVDLAILKELQREADYYQLSGLFDVIESIITPLPLPLDYTQSEIDCLLNTVTTTSDVDSVTSNPRNMTKSSLDFKKKNLSTLSFTHATFVHNASFSGSILKETSFYGCEFASNVKVDFANSDLTGADFRQCRAFTVGPWLTNGRSRKPPLYGTSCSSFLCLIQEKKVVFQGAKLHGTKFDPGVLECIQQIEKPK